MTFNSLLSATGMVLRWALISIFLVCAEIVALLITPFVVLFANRDTGRLPPAFWWMETVTSVLPGPRNITGGILDRFGWWAASTYWLWRNAVNALANRYRVDPDFNTAVMRQWNSHGAIAREKPYQPGVSLLLMRWGDQWAFELRACCPTTRTQCIFFRAGWKLTPWFEGRRPEQPTATGMLQAPSLRPFQGRV